MHKTNQPLFVDLSKYVFFDILYVDIMYVDEMYVDGLTFDRMTVSLQNMAPSSNIRKRHSRPSFLVSCSGRFSHRSSGWLAASVYCCWS